MKLRHQLLFISLLLLILPWSAWQYLKSFDEALRDSQSQSLIDNALLIADRLALEPQLFEKPFIDAGASPSILYAYRSESLPIVDGYDDNGRDYINNDSVSNLNVEGITVKALNHLNQFYFFIAVKDKVTEYHNPLSEIFPSGDHISFRLFNALGKSKTYIIQTSAPGNVIAQYQDEDGRIHQELGIKGVWRENSEGYQLELEVNSSLFENGFELSVLDYDSGQVSSRLFTNNLNSNANSNINNSLTRIITPSSSLTARLKKLSISYSHLSILNYQQWLIAQIDQKPNTTSQQSSPWVIEWFYRKLLDSNELPVRTSIRNRAYIDYVEVQQAVDQKGSLQWYRLDNRYFGSRTLASVAVPIYNAGKLLGYVLLEKNTDNLVKSTTKAFHSLFLYIGGAFVLVVLMLLLYASWLSWRISRLNRAATQVVSEEGEIVVSSAAWPDLNKHDELGDLSRGYRDLLLRLQEYNGYLRTLSNKLSHELRTPIAVVKSSLENLSQVDNKVSQKEYCQRAQEGIDRLSSILNAMSTANRIEESVANAEFDTVDLNQFFPVLMDMYRDTYPEAKIEFFSSVTQAVTDISQELFVQMMDKLIDNAVDFSLAEEPVQVNLATDKKYLYVQVENAGPLLPDKMEGQLFESMVSLRSGKDHSEKGGTSTHLGLGLYIVRLIADLHKARVIAENRNDQSGVIFTVILPYPVG
ncbi:MAG: ATP-binding protein [Cellvibrionaceae bacterium]